MKRISIGYSTAMTERSLSIKKYKNFQQYLVFKMKVVQKEIHNSYSHCTHDLRALHNRKY